MDQKQKSQMNEKLNAYLKEIEDALKGVSVVDRSDILMELHSHIIESVETNGVPLETVINGLGKPHEVANRYLISRGIEPVFRPKSKRLRNFLIAVAAMIIVFFIGITLLIRSFLPVVDVDDKSGRVKILGGLIDVDDKAGKVSIGKGLFKVQAEDLEFEFENFEHKTKINGNFSIDSESNFEVEGINGAFEIKTTKNQDLEYKCSLSSNQDIESEDSTKILERILAKDGKRIRFAFDSSIEGVKCRFNIPNTLKVTAKLLNGTIDIEEPEQSILAEITNGKINFSPSNSVEYNLKTEINRGVVTGRNEVVNVPKGHQVDLKVSNGMIQIN